jgi:hypothetical protein
MNVFLLLLSFILSVYRLPIHPNEENEKWKGITIAAPERQIGDEAFARIKSTGCNWVALVPYGFSRLNETKLDYNLKWQWWGEKVDGITSCIISAQKFGLKVMLKPQVYLGNDWIGHLDFKNEKDWLVWEGNYKKYILEFAQIAHHHQIEAICIGTELDNFIKKRPEFWKSLVKEIRLFYKGKLTYSANWDQYDQLEIWSDLDFIGISSYFPLNESKLPSIEVLKKNWLPYIVKLEKLHQKFKKPILFTEYGYMSIDGCAGKTWEIEKTIPTRPINHTSQCNAFDALWMSLGHKKWWSGGFIWKWFPDNMGHEGYPQKDYTPQDKPAEQTIKKWFSKY